MKIQQFEDKGLAHYSYAILSECQKQVVLVDPARNPQPYYDFAQEQGATIVGVIETHPHADFVSSHLEIHQQTGAIIYTHSLVGADYPHTAFDEGVVLEIGKIKLKSLHTPGHSPDSISIVLEHDGKDKAVFTGDTLFIGDVGRPDLRENAGNLTAKREELARQMYHSTREKLMYLADDVVVYPAHGAGTLCGKALSEANSSTIGQEKRSNPALQDMTEDQFVTYLTSDQPFIPKYFGYDVALNKQGAPNYQESLLAVKRLEKNSKPEKDALIIDARPQAEFKKGHLAGAYNLQNGGKFETWLGSIVDPKETFYLLAQDDKTLDELIDKASRIGYESKIKGAFVMDAVAAVASPEMDVARFKEHPEHYTIVDLRNASEVKDKKYFANALNIPLPELRERAMEIPTDKPVVIHCAGGYRSAAGSSIVEAALPTAKVFDLSEAINEFRPL
ncbi:sulfurtransferase [Rufibacter sp. DG15C]|uniref:MBL fold metallo-hydrolase n=1 Tax=Rufibacter sp. DG15C TaxID=1379909 RepID=UPI00078EC054|nr:rhodanese-like domain-containing protein [Rufibacter sp. DG15C]AMM49912.1 sulfurtransferase [Rufibacter sp. DG15C]